MTTELERILGADTVARLNRALYGTVAAVEGREPRWRYYNVGRSMNRSSARGFPMFAWSTERAGRESDGLGVFQSWRWEPTRSGWIVRAQRTHRKRKDAKARARRMRDAYAAKHERS